MQNLTIAILSILLLSCAEDTSYPKSKDYDLSLSLYRAKKYEEAKEIVTHILATASSNRSELAHANLLLAYVNYKQDSLEQAYHNCKTANSYFLVLKDDFYSSKSYHRLGQIFYDLGSYTKALGYFELALSISKASNNQKQLINDLHAAGKSNKRLGHFEMALRNFFEARAMAQQIQDLNKFLNIQLEIGIVQRMADNHQLAIDHCWQVMNSATGTPYENLFKGKAYNNLGYAYFELGDYQKAEQYLTQSLNYTDRGDTFVAATYNNLGSVYNKLGNHTKASACFQKSVELNQHKVDMEELIFTFNSIRSLPEVKSNNDSLIYYMDLFAAIAAPIIASKESLETKDLRYRLEGLELAENEKASRETIPLWVLVCTIAVLLLSVLFLYFRVRFQLNRRSSDMRKFDEYMKIKQKENAEWMKKIKKDQDMLLS
ncbi:MAG: tetratricopeptide repeat protein [Reichenbachiella sp.]|uniref:tetratricopeptide repeat protein n=2 Tax=Reichenbachiella sp. TaxID=2184521 RepID=UPI003265E3F6